MDEDLDTMSREQLIVEIRKLRLGIRMHRDSSGHELCWHHPALLGLLPEPTGRIPTVPTWSEFLRGCVRYRESLDEQLPDAPRSGGSGVSVRKVDGALARPIADGRRQASTVTDSSRSGSIERQGRRPLEGREEPVSITLDEELGDVVAPARSGLTQR